MPKQNPRYQFALLTRGSHRAGTGHLFRSLQIWQALRQKGHHVEVFTDHVAFARKIFSLGDPSPPPIHPARALLRGGPWHAILADRLESSTREIRSWKRRARVVAVIDDAGAGARAAELSFSNLYANPFRRGPGTYAGMRYAILNPELTKRPSRPRRRLRRILVLQGGSDPKRLVPKIGRALLPLLDQDSALRLVLRVGPAAKYGPRDWDGLKAHPRVELVRGTYGNVAELYRRADIAVASAGVSALELLALGVPSIFVSGIPREVETMRAIARAGAGISLALFGPRTALKLRSEVKRLAPPARRVALSRRARRAVDGRGLERMVALLEKAVAQIES